MDPNDKHWTDWHVYADSALTVRVVRWTWTCCRCGTVNTTERDRGNSRHSAHSTRAGEHYSTRVYVRCGHCHDTEKQLHWPKPRPKTRAPQ